MPEKIQIIVRDPYDLVIRIDNAILGSGGLRFEIIDNHILNLKGRVEIIDNHILSL